MERRRGGRGGAGRGSRTARTRTRGGRGSGAAPGAGGNPQPPNLVVQSRHQVIHLFIFSHLLNLCSRVVNSERLFCCKKKLV